MKAPKATDWPQDYREQFWNLYPRRAAKKAALKALDRVHASGEVTWEKLTAAIARYTEHVRSRADPRYTKHPSTWLNQGCWDDELPQTTPQKLTHAGNGFASVRRGLMN